jgi:uncharacterized membrane protein YphA (DoxX/SURF4 family)
VSVGALQAFAGAGAGELFLIARVLFGGVLAFMGVNHFLNTDAMAGYAEAKGVPAARLSVTFTGGMLVVGGLSILTGAFVVVGAGALAVFLLVTTPLMHDFWTQEGEAAQNEMTSFLKNVVMLAGALGFLALASVPWPYAVSAGL